MRAAMRTALFSTIAFTFSLYLASCGSTSNPAVSNTTGNSGTGAVPAVSALAVEVNGVAPNRKQEVQFSEAMNPDTINGKTFLIADAGGNQIAGTVTYDPDYNVASFQPASALETNTQYTGTITTGAQSVGGMALAANYTYSFATRASTDSSPLSVTSVSPAPNAQGVSPTTVITITFDEAPDASTVTSGNIVVTDSTGNKIPASLSTNISTTQVIVIPKSALPSGNIIVTVSGVADLAGAAMQQPYTWTFSTANNGGGGGNGNFTILHTFENTEGANPQAALIQDSAGNLYSTAEYGGSYQAGTAFRLTPTGTFSVMHNFGSPSTDGSRPQSPLLADGTGNFYGTTYVGGNSCGDFQCGTVFKIDSSGNESIVHAFGPSSSSDGAFPVAGLIADAAGNFYGTTWGGSNNSSAYSVAYQLTPSGSETILHNFSGGSDGIRIYSPLVMDNSGNLWGTTYAGGGTGCGGSGCGTIFRLAKTSSGWTETVTYRFSGGADGANPYAGLTWDPNRHVFYGATEFGGAPSGCAADTNGCGVLFQFDATGTTETVLHNFSGQSDGGQPVANLVLDSRGDLWGTTTIGGDLSCPANNRGCGTVFGLAPGTQFATIHTFTGGADGAVPYGALLVDENKPALYGTATVGGDPNCQTQQGGGPGCGTVFQITP